MISNTAAIENNQNNVTTLRSTPTPRTSKEVIAANVKLLIEQLEAETLRRSNGLPHRYGPLSQLQLGDILEIARQKPDATRVVGLYAWNQLDRKVSKGQKGIRILAPMIGSREKKDTEASSKDTPQWGFVKRVQLSAVPTQPEARRDRDRASAEAAVFPQGLLR